MKLPELFIYPLSIALLLSACDKPQSSPQPSSSPSKPGPASPAAPTVNIDTDKLLQSMASAGPEERSRAGKAAQAIRARNYEAGQNILELLLAEGHLTPEQKQLVTDIVAQLKQAKAPQP